MKEQVLFVDDDPGLLSGLKRMLRSTRDSWDITFASTGTEALQAMKTTCFDVVVTDMRMPEISGGELLAEVKKVCPQSVRIILSGQADLDLIMTAIGPTHQYLSKPCDAEVLKDVIRKACVLRKTLKSQHLKEIVSQVTNVPVQPDAHAKVIAELSKDSPSFSILSETIGADIGMTSHILQLVNSAFFGTRREINSISQAVGMVGLKLLKDVIYSKKLFELNAKNFALLGLLKELNDHSRLVADNAAVIGSLEGGSDKLPDDFYTAGLLHDIGKVLLALTFPDQYSKIYELAKTQNLDLETLEKENFEASHSEVGAYLIGLWGLPETVVSATANHSHPTEDVFGATSIVHVANALAYRQSGKEDWMNKIDREHLKRLGVEDKLSEWMML